MVLVHFTTKNQRIITHIMVLGVLGPKYCSNVTYTMVLVDFTITNQRNVTHTVVFSVLGPKYCPNITYTMVFVDFTIKINETLHIQWFWLFWGSNIAQTLHIQWFWLILMDSHGSG